MENEPQRFEDGWVPRAVEPSAEIDSSGAVAEAASGGQSDGADGPPSDAPHVGRELLLELAKLANPKSSWQKNIGVLIVSIVLFFSLGLADEPFSGVLVIVGALLAHEMGHVLGMKLFKYRNVSMFFIPFFGAAVSGRSIDAPGWKRALVTLMGPIAGLAAAFALFVLWLATTEGLAATAALTFAFLNLFNLLPFYPLDGGRFLQQVLFSRSRYLDAVFRVVMALLTVTVAVWLEAWILAVIGLVVIFGTGIAYKTGTVVKRLRADPGFPRVVDPDELSAETIVATRDELRRVFPERAAPAMEAHRIWSVWQRLNARPPGSLASAGLLVLYVLAIIAVPVAPVAYAFAATEESVVETRGPDGSTKRKLVSRAHATPFWEAELNEDDLYHGATTLYFFGSKKGAETWREGFPDGEWVTYGDDGKPKVTVVFERGEFVSRWDRSAAGTREWKPDQLPEPYRAVVAGIRGGGPYGVANRFGLSSEVVAPLQ